MQTTTRLSFGDLMRRLQLSRAVLDRVIRDYGRDLPEPEVVAGCRLWRVEDLGAFEAVVRRDEEVGR